MLNDFVERYILVISIFIAFVVIPVLSFIVFGVIGDFIVDFVAPDFFLESRRL